MGDRGRSDEPFSLFATRNFPSMRTFKGTATTNHEILVAYLWERADWVPTHELVKLSRPYGFVGSAGDVRVRELARDECSEHLKGKVERARGAEIGLDRRFEY